jgi:hypothetical protein
MTCPDPIPLTPLQSFLAAVAAGVFVVSCLVIVYLDLRNQERERPKENWRGPIEVRYIKHLTCWFLDGAISAIGSMF